MKELKSVRYIVVHCTATRCNKPFSVEKLINCGVGKYGQCSYHYYVRLDGTVVPLLPESVQGVHARGYNSCSLGVVYEGGVDENGKEYKLESENKGAYAEYKGAPEYERFRIRDNDLMNRIKSVFGS